VHTGFGGGCAFYVVGNHFAGRHTSSQGKQKRAKDVKLLVHAPFVVRFQVTGVGVWEGWLKQSINMFPILRTTMAELKPPELQ
jgi:hypothetical protein